MSQSNRFRLIVVGVAVVVVAMVLVAVTDLPAEEAQGFITRLEILLGLGIAADTARRMGGDRA